MEAIGIMAIALIAFFLIARKKKDAGQAGTAATPQSVNHRSPTYPPANDPRQTLQRSTVRAEVDTGLEEFRIVPLRDPSTVPRTSASTGWVSHNGEVTVAGLRIAGGLIYVAKQLTVPGRYGPDRCLINPTLPVGARAASGENLGLPYWPAYSEITPVARRMYLEWLAGGRADPAADIGFVFLFFYGLERRLLLERQTSEASILTSEVERLLDIYGGNHSFRSYASSFMTAAALLAGERPRGLVPHPTHEWSGEIPLATRVHLGFLLRDGSALSADDALLWIVGHPETNLRTPGKRCFPELRQLFGSRFGERYPIGLKIRPPKKCIQFTYRAAAGTFAVEVEGPHKELPDISNITSPIGALRDLLEGCQADLEAYSRFLGRKPEERETLQAAQLLPAALQGDAIQRALSPLRANLSSLLNDSNPAQITMRALTTALGMTPAAGANNKLTQATVSAIAQRMDALDFGMEPDRRYGGRTPALDEPIVVFAASNGGAVDHDRPAFVSAKAAIEVAILTAIADGHLSADEFSALTDQARNEFGLEASERARLEAFLWSIRSRASGGNALKRAAALQEEARQNVAATAVRAALADGVASLREVAFLERVYQALGLPVESLHSALHQSSTATSPSQVVAPRLASAPFGHAATHDGIDAKRLERIRAETLEVSALLSDIFSDEVEDGEAEGLATEEPSETLPEPEQPLVGLDAAHRKLLAIVLHAHGMPLSDFEHHARGLHLLPEGAMETVNDWGFDRFGETILDVSADTVVVPEHILTELKGA